jgi:hypothetical protein
MVQGMTDVRIFVMALARATKSQQKTKLLVASAYRENNLPYSKYVNSLIKLLKMKNAPK